MEVELDLVTECLPSSWRKEVRTHEFVDHVERRLDGIFLIQF